MGRGTQGRSGIEDDKGMAPRWRGKARKRKRRQHETTTPEELLLEMKTLTSTLLSSVKGSRQETLPPSGDMLAKDWDPLFSKPQKPNDDRIFVESRREIFLANQALCEGNTLPESDPRLDSDHNGIHIFLRDMDHSTALIDINDVETFGQNTSLQTLQSGNLPTGEKKAAWVDDRQFSNSKNGKLVRKHDNPLTATALYHLLKKPRFDDEDLPDADRRLIYIRDLDKWFILTLAETAPSLQVTALRDAIENHLDRHISISVHLGDWSCNQFQLSLHLPYFELRRSPIEIDHCENVKSDREKKMIDLSSLDISSETSSGKGAYVAKEACFSFMLCGSDHQHHVGYCFDNRDLENCEELHEMEFPYIGVHEDPIASDYGGNILNANIPISDPRAYFLVILELRSVHILNEWKEIGKLMQKKIKIYEHDSESILLQHNKADRASYNQKTTEAHNWYHQTQNILEKLSRVSEETLEAWNVFHSPGGDCGYFKDVGATAEERRKNLSLLRAINETFESLGGIHRKLISSRDTCQRRAQNLNTELNLRLNVENNEATQHAKSTTEWTLSVFTPLALTIAYFSMPQAVIPFHMSFRSFLIALVVITAIVRFLFLLFGGRLRQSWLWRITGAEVHLARLQGAMPSNFYSALGYNSNVLAAINLPHQRRPTLEEPSVEGTGLNNWGSDDMA